MTGDLWIAIKTFDVNGTANHFSFGSIRVAFAISDLREEVVFLGKLRFAVCRQLLFTL